MLRSCLFQLLLTVALLRAPGAWAQTAAAPVAKSRVLAVRGTATAEVEPERVELLITYRVADNVKEADKAKAQEQALVAALQGFGVPRDKLVLDNLTAYGHGGFSKSYNTNVSLTKVYRLTLDKPAGLNDLIPRLVQTGADNVSVARLESSQLEARKQQVLVQALASARQKAEALARQLGQTLGAAVSVVEVVPARLPLPDESAPAYKRATLHEQTAVEPAPNLRTIPVSSAVDVQYELK